jgi:hypothetical protein
VTTTPPVVDVEPTRFRRAPVITEAIRWDGTPEHALALIRWMKSDPERGDIPEAQSAYWVEHEADRDRYVMSFRSFGLTDHALAGDWVVRALAGVYSATPDAHFRVLYTEADGHEPAVRVRERFAPGRIVALGAVSSLGATTVNAAALFYALAHSSAEVPTFALAALAAVNAVCIAGMGRVVRYFRKRFA